MLRIFLQKLPAFFSQFKRELLFHIVSVFLEITGSLNPYIIRPAIFPELFVTESHGIPGIIHFTVQFQCFTPVPESFIISPQILAGITAINI